MTNAQLINQTSGDVEYYTPPEIICAAWQTMGRIDLDPASSEVANRGIGAKCFFTRQIDGLSLPWHGNIFMNHPFGRAEAACASPCPKQQVWTNHKCHDYPFHGNAAWINKLINEFLEGRVQQACCLTFACTSEAWFQPLLSHIQCFLCPRTNYYLPDGTIKRGVTKGSVVTYLGPNVHAFRAAFSSLGTVK